MAYDVSHGVRRENNELKRGRNLANSTFDPHSLPRACELAAAVSHSTQRGTRAERRTEERGPQGAGNELTPRRSRTPHLRPERGAVERNRREPG